ncbi:MAG: cbb3-type cytochrome oxidase assembly protein CcoS [Planctomycetes bacterium]|nr:cbb3-type cytochrome oxidase assembly protein CcoS [Planctomycetota bacterium]
MDILYIAIPMALGIAGFFVIAFLWSVSNGQLDDLETPALRMLFDDEPDFGKDRSAQVDQDSAQKPSKAGESKPETNVSEM